MVTKKLVQEAYEEIIHKLKEMLDGSPDRVIRHACLAVDYGFTSLQEEDNNVYVVLGLDSRVEGIFSNFKYAYKMVENKLLMSTDIQKGIWTYGTKYTDAFEHVSTMQTNTIIRKGVQ